MPGAGGAADESKEAAIRLAGRRAQREPPIAIVRPPAEAACRRAARPGNAAIQRRAVRDGYAPNIGLAGGHAGATGRLPVEGWPDFAAGCQEFCLQLGTYLFPVARSWSAPGCAGGVIGFAELLR